MVRKLKTFVGCMALLLVSLGLVAVAAELLLQLTEIGAYSHNRRVLFYSQPSYEYLGAGVIHYFPNTPIRTVAVYGNHIDYDVTNSTNDLGFYDDVDYLPSNNKTRNIAFLGDSFTSGSGGTEPWVSILRRMLNRNDLRLYNLGVSGTGVPNFVALLEKFSDDLALDEVNIMIITSDLYRSAWYPLINDEGVRLCRNLVSQAECKRNHQPTMVPILHSDTDRDILNRAQELYQKKGSDTDMGRGVLHKLRLYNLLCNAAYGITKDSAFLLSSCPHLRIFRMREGQKDILFQQSIKLIADIKKAHPELKFRVFHIPEKGETYRGRYAVNIVEELKKLEIDYVPLLLSCQWKVSYYHKHDGHPNDKGYQHLARCMQPYLH